MPARSGKLHRLFSEMKVHELSAQITKFAAHEFLTIPLINIMNKKGPNILPWDTLHSTDNIGVLAFPCITFCFRTEKEFDKHLEEKLLMPKCSNFFNCNDLSTESTASARSIKISSVYVPLSKFEWMYWTASWHSNSKLKLSWTHIVQLITESLLKIMRQLKTNDCFNNLTKIWDDW